VNFKGDDRGDGQDLSRSLFLPVSGDVTVISGLPGLQDDGVTKTSHPYI